MPTEYAIEMKGITKTFGSVVANRDVELNVRQGEILALLGENGSGKTTLMNMLSGIYKPDSGAILVNGRQAVINSPEDAKRLGIGMVHQHFKLVDIFSAADNIWLGDEKSGPILKKDRYAVIQEMARKFGFDIDPRKKVYNMAVSEKQTLEIIKVLYYGAKVIILDEPTVGLDPAQMIEIRNLIHDLGKTHTVILSSHILSEVQTVCDRVLIIAHGKLVAQGTPEELAGKLAAKGTISATAQGERDAVLAAAATVPGLTDLRVTAEKGGEVSFTAVSESGADLRGALSLALAKAGCPVLNLRAESMSLEDVFLQLTEAPEETETTETETNEQEAE